MKNTRLRPGQRRRSDPMSPERVREREMKNTEDKARYGEQLEAQKSIMGDLKNLSDQHAEHGRAVAEVDRISKEQTVNLKAAMLDPRYTGQRAEGPDPAYRAWVDAEWKKIYPGEVEIDRMPSSGKSLHGDSISSEINLGPGGAQADIEENLLNDSFESNYLVTFKSVYMATK